MSNRPRDQDCTVQFFCVGIGVGIDAVVCRVSGKWDGEFLSELSKTGSERDVGGFGEVEGLISGHLGVKTSKDWYRCLCVITNQYTEALTEVWLAASSLTMSTTARGGQRRRFLVLLRGVIGFNSCVLGKIHCALSFLYLAMCSKGWRERLAAGLGCRFGLRIDAQHCV